MSNSGGYKLGDGWEPKTGAGEPSSASVCSVPRGSLAEKVATLERRADELSDLLGAILATLKVNWLRGQLTVGNGVDDVDAAKAKFEQMMADWSAARHGAGYGEKEPNTNIRQTDFRNTARKENE